MFTVEPASYYGPPAATPESRESREGRGANYWSRKGPDTLTVVIGEKEKKFWIKKDNHINIYTDAYEIFTARWDWLWYRVHIM